VAWLAVYRTPAGQILPAQLADMLDGVPDGLALLVDGRLLGEAQEPGHHFRIEIDGIEARHS
jgi:hypothetical protein